MKRLTLIVLLASVISAANAGEKPVPKQASAHDYEMNLFAVQTVATTRLACTTAVGKKHDECVDLEFDRAAMRVSAVSELVPIGKSRHDFAVETYDRLVRVNRELANTP